MSPEPTLADVAVGIVLAVAVLAATWWLIQ